MNLLTSLTIFVISGYENVNRHNEHLSTEIQKLKKEKKVTSQIDVRRFTLSCVNLFSLQSDVISIQCFR